MALATRKETPLFTFNVKFMEQTNSEKVIEIIRREIELEDDMLGLYASMIAKDSCLEGIKENDLIICKEIINGLLRDTERHKKTMQEIISKL